MKHIYFLLLLLPLMGCTHTTVPSPVPPQTPITPIHYESESFTIHRTDYLPWLEDSLMTIQTSNRLSTLRQDGCDLVILPQLPFQFGLVTLAQPRTDQIEFAILKNGKRHSEFLHIIALVGNQLLDSTRIRYDNETTSYTLTLPFQMPKRRSFLRIYAQSNTHLYNDLLIPLQDGKPVTQTKQLTRHDQQAQVLYSILVDRFNNGNMQNDWKLNSPEVLDIVDYQGGDLAGITQKIEEGFFDSLGVNTLWVSPISQNPWDAWGRYPFPHGNKYDPKRTYTKFSAYHGYWPTILTQVDQRFGSDTELDSLLATAHRHNINIILDYVANHLHIQSPTYQQHPDWHTDSILPDGRRNFELWDEARLTTWFDTHIPTLDLEREDICQNMTDSALYWLERYDLDGFRHDACKHIPEGYWRLLTHKMVTRFPGRPLWMIGETYGSPQLIGSYVKTGMLNAQFDFNVYFTLRDVLLGNGSMTDVLRVVTESAEAYGSHHTMGNISGNHDQVRFASLAGGAIRPEDDGKEEGWTRTVGIGNPTIAYRRTLLQEVLNMTLPGVPCIYQGDEYGEVGGNDPDNRHMMRFDERLNEQEAEMKQHVRELIRLRRNSLPLLYGDFVPVHIDNHSLVFDRIYFGQTVRVTIDRKHLSYTIQTFVLP
ncbi:MAG: hypothetical protein IJ838_00705 [Paludibacteraceae bacterium]|nr:hypothetical protein [Paludibacteraceae bacterium]